MGYENILLGEGKVYWNYGEVDEEELGYIRGGTFNENLVIRHIEVDGKKSKEIEDAVVESVDPTLEVTFMEITSDNMQKYFSFIDVDSTTPSETKITRRYQIAAADYCKNITFLGKKKNGKDFGVSILNALSTGPINLANADKSETEVPAVFVGSGQRDDTHAPFEIIIDESV